MVPPMGALDSWRFCPVCGEAIEKIEDRAECPACGYVGYANAVPGAEAVCFDERGRVLLGGENSIPARCCGTCPEDFCMRAWIRSTAFGRRVWEGRLRVS